MFDCIIIGGGPAGMSAAIYLARKKMNIVLVSPEFGGQAAKSAEVENYLGFTKLSGAELTGKFHEHMTAIGVAEKQAEAKSIAKNGDIFEVKTSDETLQTKSVVITSGKTPRKLNIPGEENFLGKGISYCATCDGPLFKDKTVTVVGGGNSALDAALEMGKYAQKVYMINLNEDFQGDEIRKDRVKESSKIEVIAKAQTTGVSGSQFLEKIKYKDLNSNQEKEIESQGMFVEIGWMPATEIAKDLVELNNLKEIKIDRENKTSSEGIFAAGDVTDILDKQIIIAAGEGAKAALSAWKYIVTKR
jgi:alkyl hydroperoxide reductase subunit F